MAKRARIAFRCCRSSRKRTRKLKPPDLINTARHLAAHGRKPTQADLKRAVSTAYYALFHTLCRNCADSFIGGQAAARSERAWLQTYRAVDHTYAARQCRDGRVIPRFPKEIEDFANMYTQMQIKRVEADYNPMSKFTRSEVMADIDAVEAVMEGFRSVHMKDRRAFAAWVTIKQR